MPSDSAHNDDVLEISTALRGNSCLRVIRLGGNRSLTLEPRPFLDGALAALHESRVCRLELDGTGISFAVQARLRGCCLRNASYVQYRPYQRLLLATLHQRPDLIVPMQGTAAERLVLIGDILEMIAEKMEVCRLSPLPPPMDFADRSDAFYDDAFSAAQIDEMVPAFQWHEAHARPSV